MTDDEVDEEPGATSGEEVAVVPFAVIDQNPVLRDSVLYYGSLEFDGSRTDHEVMQFESRPHNSLMDVVEVKDLAPDLYALVLKDIESQTKARDANVRNSEVVVAQSVEDSKAFNSAVRRGQWMAFGLFVVMTTAAVVAALALHNAFAAAPFLAVGLVGAVKALLDSPRLSGKKK